MDIVIPYWRYSSKRQKNGVSLERQEAGLLDWCQRNNATPDPSATYVDRARSGYHGDHRTKGDMGRFLADVNTGRIPPGRILAVENLDRFSRENPWRSIACFLDLIGAGIKILALTPEETLYHRDAPPSLIDQAVGELKRANAESKRKSEFSADNWERKRRKVRKQGGILTKRLPAWVQLVKPKLELIPDRAAVVVRIFDLCIAGWGLYSIVKQLTLEGVKPFGRGNGWTNRYVQKILKGRAVLGELQPKKGGKNDGEPLTSYYPVLLDEDRWLLAQDALKRRYKRPGRKGEKVASLFTSLIWDARTQDRMHLALQTSITDGKQVRTRSLIPAGAMTGRTKQIAFPYQTVFEPAVLDLLKEIDPASLLGQEPASEAAALTTKRIAAELKLRELEAAALEEGKDSRAVVRLITAQEAKVDELRALEDEARLRDRNPRSAAWAEAKTLLQVAQDEGVRLRLRSLLGEMLESVWVLIVPRRTHRLAAVQMNFAGGTTRHYLIHYWSAGNGRKGGFKARSFALPASDRPDKPCLDIRKSEHAAECERFLSELPLP